MELAVVGQLIDTGRYAEAYNLALDAVGVEGRSPVERAQLLLLGAQGAARLGRFAWAAKCILRAQELAPKKRALYLHRMLLCGKLALRTGDWAKAEQLFQIHLKEAPPNDLGRPYALFGLAQALEGRRQWQEAAEGYVEAAIAFARLVQIDLQVGSYQNAAWCYILAGELSPAESCLLQGTRHQSALSPKQRQVQHALDGYWEYRIGNEPEAFAQVVLALDAGQEISYWATCLAAVTSGLLAWERQDEPAVRAAYQMADSLLPEVTVESGPCYLRDLVHDLGLKVKLRWEQA